MALSKVYIKLFLVCFIFKVVFSDNITENLMKRFNDVRSHCIDSEKHQRPAYECSGIMMRGVDGIGGTEKKYAWSKNTLNKKTNAFSVAYLRKDQPFYDFPGAYETGLILYPHLNTPKVKNTYKVLCAFPLDGYTDYRRGRHGCGQSIDDKTGKSRHCDDQNITTIEKWISHYNYIKNSKNDNFFPTRQCAFDMTSEHRARNFDVVLKANKYIQKYSQFSGKNNELRIRGWNENRPEKLPIEAFFYLIGSSSSSSSSSSLGQQLAKRYQQDYFTLTGEKIPIVGIRLPRKNHPNLFVKG